MTDIFKKHLRDIRATLNAQHPEHHAGQEIIKSALALLDEYEKRLEEGSTPEAISPVDFMDLLLFGARDWRHFVASCAAPIFRCTYEILVITHGKDRADKYMEEDAPILYDGTPERLEASIWHDAALLIANAYLISFTINH